MTEVAGREELRPHLRDEPSAPSATVLVRGGPDTISLIRSHARRTHRLYCLDGAPLWGISVFGALDQEGPASRDGLLAGRLVSYEQVHSPSVGTLLAAGFVLLPSFRRPHFTIRINDDSDEVSEHLIDVLGPAEENPYNREVRLRRTERLQ